VRLRLRYFLVIVARWFAFAALLILVTACASDDAPPVTGHRVVIADARISVSVPDGVSVVGRQDRSDLTIYDFSRDDQVFMGLYVGPTPSFHPAKDEAGIDTETVGGFPAQTRVAKSSEGWSRDIVIEFPDGRFCHFFYRDLREPDLLLADHIIGSLHDGL
jgi:hypothetical protein